MGTLKVIFNNRKIQLYLSRGHYADKPVAYLQSQDFHGRIQPILDVIQIHISSKQMPAQRPKYFDEALFLINGQRLYPSSLSTIVEVSDHSDDQ